MKPKRKKDPEYHRLREVLEEFLNVAEDYRARLETELAKEQAAAEPYLHLVRPLQRQIDALQQLEAHVDDQVWPRLIELANVSAYIEHARTRDYF
jgi:hypothetical protein